MAVTVNYNNASPTLGIYGVYNEFVCQCSVADASKFKHQFRVRVTAENDTSVTYIKNVDSVLISGTFYASFDPVSIMRSLFFESEYTGQSEDTAIKSYSGLQIEVGELYATSATLAPVFQGYDTDQTFYFYNGYEKPETAGQKIGLNYREPKWYTTTPHLLPKVKKTLYLLEDDIELLSIPSLLNVYPAHTTAGLDTNLKNLVINYYEADGTLDSFSTIDLEARPDLSGIGYWNININSTFPAGVDYCEVYAQWITDGGEEGLLVDSEILTVRRQECKVKDEAYRLRWVNRYGGEEYQNFQLHTDKSISIQRGKKIASTGIDYAATTFAGISNINNPNLKEYGNESFSRYRLRTDFITQEEINAMDELFKSNSVLMFDPEIATQNEVPVIVEDSSYRVLDVNQSLQRIEINVRLANYEPNQV